MNLTEITNQVAELSREVGRFINGEVYNLKSSQIEMKGFNNLVTYVDKKAEEKIVKGLETLLPEAGFIAEENTSYRKSDTLNWIIDPLDGTTNFVHGLPPFSISIALAENNNPILGVIYEINLNECFYACEESDAFLNGQKITVSNTECLNKSLIATGFPYYDFSLINNYMNLLADLMKTTRGIRRLGSAAVDLAYVACGRFDTFYEYGLNAWDVAAGVCIVRQAGGKVTDFNFGEDAVFSREIIASNGTLHKEFTEKLKSFFFNYQ